MHLHACGSCAGAGPLLACCSGRATHAKPDLAQCTAALTVSPSTRLAPHRCDNGIVVHRDWSQLKELREGAKQRGRPAQQQADAAAAPGGGEQQAAGGAQPFMGFNVEILVQKVG
jgi:hypothetical protein